MGGTDTARFNAVPVDLPASRADAASQTIRANLVSQYNNIITQITTTSQDASFNGINLLNGDDLKLTFNETGKSTLTIKGVTFNAAGLGLAPLVGGTDFLDSAAANATIAQDQQRLECVCVRKPRRWGPTCRSCRSGRISPRT